MAKNQFIVRTSAWLPSNRKDGLIDNIQSSVKIRKARSTLQHAVDTIARLRNTRLGQFYINPLKKYALVRWLVGRLWYDVYPVYVGYIAVYISNRKAKRWYPLTKLNDLSKKEEISTCKLVSAALVDIPPPNVYPVSEQNYLLTSRDKFIFPEIFVAPIKNAMIYGGTNLILANDKVICHDLYDFARDYTSEELHRRTLINPKSERIRWLLHDEMPEPIPMAATFVDACATNYAHWITEVLPRVALFCSEERFHGIPIVINDGLHKNIMESLLLVTGADREIITLPVGGALSVDELYLTSVSGYVPFGRRTTKLSGHSDGMFSPQAFEILRNRLISLMGETEKETWPEKIFLRRNSDVRKLINMPELESMLVSQGFVIVEVEKLAFFEQVELFSNAREIVAPTGAALVNAIFCNPGTKVAVLMSKHKDMIYRYWQNMLTPFKIEVGYVLGNIVERQDSGIHGDFVIDSDALGELLKDFSKK